MPRICLIDTYYPDFLRSLRFNPAHSYDLELRKVLFKAFGTADFYSRGLTAYGWTCLDVIANYPELQAKWADEHDVQGDVLLAQIRDFEPDVVFMQDLSFCEPGVLWELAEQYVLAGQLSCPMPKTEQILPFECIFTSFPHYMEPLKSLGVHAVFNPLAFEPAVLDRLPRLPRIHDVAFVGGVGVPSHWSYGMHVLEAVAMNIPTAKFWGYGYEQLNPSSPIKQAYQGEAWGLEMYVVLSQSRIVLNRHGEVAENYANNMRMFEASGTGALLLTEAKDNIRDYFAEDECVTYTSPMDAVDKIRYYLAHEDERAEIAAKGQKRTLRDHTYAQRMKTVSDSLVRMLS